MDELDRNRGPGWAWCVFLTLAFYLSGFFVILTPVPLVYAFFRFGASALTRVALPTLLILAVLYVAGLEPLDAFFRQNPYWAWLIMPPGMNLLDTAGLKAVCVFGLGYYAFFAAAAYQIHRLLSRPASPVKTLGLTSLAFFLIIGGGYAAYAYSAGSSPVELAREYFNGLLSELVAMQERQQASPQQIGFMKDNQERLLNYSVYLSPSFLFCAILLILTVNLVLSKKFLAPFFRNVREIRFTRWSFPFYGVWVVIACLFVVLANTYLFDSRALLFTGMNGLIVMSLIYYLQGLCILAFFLDKWGVRPFGRTLIYIAILFFFQSIGFVILGVGFFDAWFDFRKLDRQDPQPSFGG